MIVITFAMNFITARDINDKYEELLEKTKAERLFKESKEYKYCERKMKDVERLMQQLDLETEECKKAVLYYNEHQSNAVWWWDENWWYYYLNGCPCNRALKTLEERNKASSEALRAKIKLDELDLFAQALRSTVDETTYNLWKKSQK